MYRRSFDLYQGRLWFRSQPVSLKRINSIAILAAARIPVQMEFLVATGICGSGRSPAAAEPGFQPRVSPVTSTGITRRAGVWSETRPSAFQYHSPTRPSPRIRYSVPTAVENKAAAALEGTAAACGRLQSQPTY